MASARPGSDKKVLELPKTEIELSISARNLKDADVFSKSDPICILYTKSFGQEQYVEYGRTEIIWNTLNPDFVTKFTLDYYFEEKQEVRFELYDIDDPKTENLRRQDALGCMECTLGQIVSSISIEKPLLNISRENARGTIRVSAEEVQSSKEEYVIVYSGLKITKKPTFIRISRETETELWTAVHQTQPCKESPNVSYEEIHTTSRALCNGDFDRKLKVSVYEYKSNGSHKLFGESLTCLRKITRGPGFHNELKLSTEESKGKKNGKDTESKLILESFTTRTQSSFVDYIQAGTEIQVTVAIDFTSSNGDPNDPTSLHYNGPGSCSAYASAIQNVVSILEDYDSDKKIPAFGFGAKCSEEAGDVSMFALNGNIQDAEVDGTEGVLNAYKTALDKVRFYGPTKFAAIINHVAEEASKAMNGDAYHILLMLTDGCISDMPDTKQAIIQAASYPLSIIIVGIGDEDFAAMNVLDGDSVRLSHRGKEAERDIVQFVEYNKCKCESTERSMMLLSKAVLHEVPDQVTGFMTSRAIHPTALSSRRNRSLKATLV